MSNTPNPDEKKENEYKDISVPESIKPVRSPEDYDSMPPSEVNTKKTRTPEDYDSMPTPEHYIPMPQTEQSIEPTYQGEGEVHSIYQSSQTGEQPQQDKSENEQLLDKMAAEGKPFPFSPFFYQVSSVDKVKDMRTAFEFIRDLITKQMYAPFEKEGGYAYMPRQTEDAYVATNMMLNVTIQSLKALQSDINKATSPSEKTAMLKQYIQAMSQLPLSQSEGNNILTSAAEMNKATQLMSQIWQESGKEIEAAVVKGIELSTPKGRPRAMAVKFDHLQSTALPVRATIAVKPDTPNLDVTESKKSTSKTNP